MYAQRSNQKPEEISKHQRSTDGQNPVQGELPDRLVRWSVGGLILIWAFLLGAASPNLVEQTEAARADGISSSFETVDEIEPEHLRSVLIDPEADVDTSPAPVVEAPVVAAPVVAMYEERTFAPLWLQDADSRAQARELLKTIAFCPNYAFDEPDLTQRLSSALHLIDRVEVRAETLAHVESDLTRAYWQCAEYLVGEHELEPGELGWEIPVRERPDPLEVVAASVITSDSPEEIIESLEELKPPHPQAALLGEAVADYRRVVSEGGWSELPAMETLEIGDAIGTEMLTALVERLEIEGFMNRSEIRQQEIYSPALSDAVARFQGARGLLADGKLGKKTLAALNVPAVDRLRQLEVNLERSRWLPAPGADVEIWANLAAFRLWVLEQGEEVENMRVMIGRPDWQTPIFRDEMEYLVVNPAWNVPASIAIDEVVDRFSTEPEEILAEGFEVFDGYEPGAPKVDPTTIDWESVSADEFRYRVRQRPGPQNPLGQVKFIFPNEHSVYLHDTSASPALFERANRAFSHGCVRLEEPWELARAILPWESYTEVQDILASRERTTVLLEETIPVTLVYMTAWVNRDGVVEMYDDIYDRDEALDHELASQEELEELEELDLQMIEAVAAAQQVEPLS